LSGSVGILGTGLIGASIGMRARERGMRVVGADARAQNAQLALRRGALDEIGERADVLACDVVVLAAPIDATVTELQSPDLRASRASLILDVASVKGPIVDAGAGVARFVASHPMAGSERSGPGAAEAALFVGRPWAYVPAADAAASAAMQTFAREMGATPYAVDARVHDRIVARTSHVPQLFAWLMARRFDEDDCTAVDGLMGPVARELSRLSRSDKALWREILLANAANVENELRLLSGQLREAADALHEGKPPV
jgi:prephenate dehydrogenase